jgi:hypothetical protein
MQCRICKKKQKTEKIQTGNSFHVQCVKGAKCNKSSNINQTYQGCGVKPVVTRSLCHMAFIGFAQNPP